MRVGARIKKTLDKCTRIYHMIKFKSFQNGAVLKIPVLNMFGNKKSKLMPMVRSHLRVQSPPCHEGFHEDPSYKVTELDDWRGTARNDHLRTVKTK